VLGGGHLGEEKPTVGTHLGDLRPAGGRSHGRFADAQAIGGGNRESLSAPLASKTEWTSGGVSVEFTGGQSPAYRVVHEGRVIKEFPATATWRRDLEQAKQLARSMTRVGRSMKRRCVALVTDMNQPLGDTVGTALEINAHYYRLDLKDQHARLARDLGAMIIINTDAHSTEGLDQMRYGITTARRAWLRKGDVLNTQPVKEIAALAPQAACGLILACTSPAFGRPGGEWQQAFLRDRLAPLAAGPAGRRGAAQ
jgi:hypothetical protein